MRRGDRWKLKAIESRKQKEVYSAQINRVNLQSNGALVNINALYNDKSPSSLLRYPIVPKFTWREVLIFYNSGILELRFFVKRKNFVSHNFRFRFLRDFVKYCTY